MITDNQRKALLSLHDGEWKYGISIDGRRALVSLKKRGLVDQYHQDGSACQWQITPAGYAAFPACEREGGEK